MIDSPLIGNWNWYWQHFHIGNIYYAAIFSPAFKPVDLILQIRKEPASVRAVHLRVVELKRHAQQIL
jgi:hypothetical protein